MRLNSVKLRQKSRRLLKFIFEVIYAARDQLDEINISYTELPFIFHS